MHCPSCFQLRNTRFTRQFTHQPARRQCANRGTRTQTRHQHNARIAPRPSTCRRINARINARQDQCQDCPPAKSTFAADKWPKQASQYKNTCRRIIALGPISCFSNSQAPTPATRAAATTMFWCAPWRAQVRSMPLPGQVHAPTVGPCHACHGLVCTF